MEKEERASEEVEEATVRGIRLVAPTISTSSWLVGAGLFNGKDMALFDDGPMKTL